MRRFDLCGKTVAGFARGVLRAPFFWHYPTGFENQVRDVDVTKPTVASLDSTRSRLRLPRHLVPIALLLVDYPGQLAALGTTGLASLEAAGVATAGSLHPTALRILTPVFAPRYVVSVDVFRDDGPTIATVWCDARLATVGTSQDREIFVLDPVEPALIPFHLAALAGVCPLQSSTEPALGEHPVDPHH